MHIQHLINGRPVDSAGTIESINPATQQVLAEAPCGGDAEVHAAVARRPPAQRGDERVQHRSRCGYGYGPAFGCGSGYGCGSWAGTGSGSGSGSGSGHGDGCGYGYGTRT